MLVVTQLNTVAAMSSVLNHQIKSRKLSEESLFGKCGDFIHGSGCIFTESDRGIFSKQQCIF